MMNDVEHDPELQTSERLQPKPPNPTKPPILGGSWVVISRIISRVTVLITHIRGLLTPLITTPEPPSTLNPKP